MPQLSAAISLSRMASVDKPANADRLDLLVGVGGKGRGGHGSAQYGERGKRDG